jgi:phenylalanyl-tRNA synthetase beta chain
MSASPSHSEWRSDVRVPVSWLREYVELPAGVSGSDLDHALVSLGIEVESVVDLAATVQGCLVVGRVLEIEELTGFKKPIRFCLVDVGAANGTGEPQEIVCGATNFSSSDLVVVILPGGVLPGGFAIGARRTYGHNSNGMICSARELGLGDDHTGIIVLPPDTTAAPGEDARPVVGLDDVVLELEITPDRGYAMSVRGIARELSHAYGVGFREACERNVGLFHDPGVHTAPGATAEPAYPVHVRDPLGCDRFAGRVVRGIDPSAPSPQWLRRRLTVAGVRTISLAVDVTNYVMLELGQPMHAFDLDRIRGPLVVRRAQAGERMTTLDGVHRTLDAEDMVICDDTGVISLAAVMGGETSEVMDGTTNVLLEAAHWDPVMVGRTARRHKLFSEAAKRWERGVDPALPPVALERAVGLLVEYAGGEVDERVLDINTVAPPRPITMMADKPSRVAGVEYPPERVTALLRQIGCTVKKNTAKKTGGGASLSVTPPTWRPDLTAPADLAEEVVRLDGYGAVPSELPLAPPGSGLTPQQRRRRSVGRTLAEAGYVEVLSYPFVGDGIADALGLPADDPRRHCVRLANPLSAEEPFMRTSLLPGLLATLRRNVGRGSRDVALFEQGLVFFPVEGAGTPSAMGVDRRPTDEEFAAADATLPCQPWHVGAVLAGEVEPTGWWGPGREAGWADAVEAGRIVCSAAGVVATVRAAAYAPWHPGRCAEITVDGRVVGQAGELHPAVCAALDLPRRTCAMEIDLDALPLPGVVPAPVVSTFPPALIDVALVVDAGVPAAQVEAALVDGAGELLEGIRLFDVFTGEQVGAGRRSLAYRLTLRATDRTLTAEEAVVARDAAVAEASGRLGATLRGTA